MDCHSFTALSHVRALLVPLGSLQPQRFHELEARLAQSFEVRLVDVTPTATRQFNPQGFPSGRVIYDFSTSLDNQESLFLHDYEPFRKTFVIIGITDQHLDNITEEITQLKKLYKSSVVHCGVVFDQENPPLSIDNLFYCTKQNGPETVMCDVTRLFLDELTAYLSSYQHITLRSPGTLGSNDRSKPMLPPKNKRISSGSAITISLSSDIVGNAPKLSLKSATERRGSRVKGRQTKILGNLLLLAGKYTDALKEFTDAISQLKAGYDYLWLASALEGVAVCVIMLSYLEIPYQLPSAVSGVIFSSTLPSVLSPSPTPTGSPRSSIAVNHGVPTGVSASLNGNAHLSPSSRFSVDLEALTVPELIQKIMLRVFYYYEYSRNDPEDYVPNLVYCESVLRFLKFMTALNIGGGFNEETLSHLVKGTPLKILNQNDEFAKSDILKLSNKIMSVQLRNMDILSQTRIYTSLSSIYSDLGFHRKQSFMLRTLFVSLIPQLKQNSVASLPASPSYDLQNVLNTILSVYGVSLSTESSITDAFLPKWMQLHKSIINLCINVCEEIKDFRTAVTLKSIMLTRYLDALTDNEQRKIFLDIQDITRQYSIPAPYFDPFIFRGIFLMEPSNTPKKHSKSASLKKSNTGPLIYDPFSKPDAEEKNYLVQGELAEFLIVLQNPFAFPIIINEIKMKNMEVLRNHFTIPPKSMQKVNILTKPHKSGDITIQSIYLKVAECDPQWFKIAKSQKVKLLRKLKPITDQKPILSSYISNISGNKIDNRVETDKLTVNVIPAQPSLQALNIPEPLMLLEGGTHKLQVLLKNNSSVAVNVLNYSIWDSTIEPLKRMLSDKNQPPNEVYEYEYFFYKKSLKILSEFSEIRPFEEITLDLEVQGKRGVNKINLVIDYGNSEEGGDVFTRSLEVPITAIVHPSTDLADCDVVPLQQEVDSSNHELWKFVNDHNDSVISDWCLFLVDIRNLWNKALSVEIDSHGYVTHCSIVPMETKRLLLPMKRIDLDYEHLKPIPSLSGKQYVLPKISKSEDQHLREAFWYREEILKTLKGTWSVGGISGDLELRGIRLSQKMLNVLKFDKVAINIDIKDCKRDGIHRLIKTGEFITVDITITNRSERSLRGIIRNIPTASNYGAIDRKLLYNGMLQQPLSTPVNPGESATLSIGAVVLERGEYEWGALFDEQGNDSQYISRSPLRIRSY